MAGDLGGEEPVEPELPAERRPMVLVQAVQEHQQRQPVTSAGRVRERPRRLPAAAPHGAERATDALTRIHVGDPAGRAVVLVERRPATGGASDGDAGRRGQQPATPDHQVHRATT